MQSHWTSRHSSTRPKHCSNLEDGMRSAAIAVLPLPRNLTPACKLSQRLFQPRTKSSCLFRWTFGGTLIFAEHERLSRFGIGADYKLVCIGGRATNRDHQSHSFAIRTGLNLAVVHLRADWQPSVVFNVIGHGGSISRMLPADLLDSVYVRPRRASRTAPQNDGPRVTTVRRGSPFKVPR